MVPGAGLIKTALGCFYPFGASSCLLVQNAPGSHFVNLPVQVPVVQMRYFREMGAEIERVLMVPGAGLEPARLLRSGDFKSPVLFYISIG